MRRRHEGVYINIEGGDGSGKGTQTTELANDLRDRGFNVFKISYPQYGNDSARFVERYLRGEYGAVGDIHPDLAALPFIIDRLNYETQKKLHAFLSQRGNVLLGDRGPASNAAHHATRIDDREARRTFYGDMLSLEYDVLNEPKPDLNIVLQVPADIAQMNVDSKDHSVHSYTNSKRDIHEADANHLNLALRNYNELLEFFSDEFVAVDALDATRKMRPIDEVHNDIMELIWSRGLLPKTPPNALTSIAQRAMMLAKTLPKTVAAEVKDSLIRYRGN